MKASRQVIVPNRFTLDSALLEMFDEWTTSPNFIPDALGRTSQIVFLGDKAFKFPRSDIFRPRTALSYIREAIISEDLAAAGVNVPYVYGVHSCSSDGRGLFLLAMELLPYAQGIGHLSRRKPYRFFGKSDYQKALEDRDQQIQRAWGLGYTPRDGSPYHNCGLDENGRVCLFDFQHWKTPPKIRKKIMDCRKSS